MNVVARHLVWDLPTRLFHWSLVVLVVLQYATAEWGFLDMEWHFRFGYATLALLLFRVMWGFFGSQTSRFAEFVRGPVAVLKHVRRGMSTNSQISIGHNPLGGWSVVVVLLALLVQAVSGLFSSDGVDTDGPLAAKVSRAVVKWCSRFHGWGEWILIGLIVLHVSAVLLYWLVRNDNLIVPMITGRRDAVTQPLRFATMRRALVLLGLSLAAIVGLAYWAQR